MSRFSAAGTLVFLCGDFRTSISADVQLMPLPSRLSWNFQVPSDLQNRGVVRRLRQLEEENHHDDILHGLDGEVELRHEWSCLDECDPFHDRQDVTPGNATEGVDETEMCIEEVETGALSRQIDFDLTCLGQGDDITCAEIEALDYREELFLHCNQDPDLLYGECTLLCRFGAHPTRRCTYTFDRVNKYGLTAMSNGALVWSHCALISSCDAETLLETMGLYCNRSAIDLPPPEHIVATVAPLLQTTTPEPLPIETEIESDESDDGGNGLLVGVIAAAGGSLVGGLGVFSLYKVLGKRAVRGGGGGGGNAGPDLADGAGNPSVVVGRPVTDPVAGAVAPPAGAPPIDDKGGGAAAGTPLGVPSSSTPKGD